MVTSECPKCGSQDVYRHRSPPGMPGVSTITLGDGLVFNQNNALLDNYVCTNCGYVELYLSDPKQLNYITDHWERADAGLGSDSEDAETRRLPSLPRE